MSFNYALAADCPKGGDPAAKGLVPCGVSCSCTIENIFEMIGRVYHFIVWNLATPLAVLAVLVGGILLMVSSGNPGLAGRGKSILTIAIIGLVLVFLSYLIIDTLLFALTGNHLG